jgi:hypothetical protein
MFFRAACRRRPEATPGGRNVTLYTLNAAHPDDGFCLKPNIALE